MEDWLKVSDLEARTGLSNSTVRRYIQRYLEYLPHNEIKGEYFFTQQAVDILQHIGKLTKDRRPPEEIREILLQEYGKVSDEVTVIEQQQVSNQVSRDVLSQVMQAVAQQGVMLQQMVAVLDQRQEIAELRAKIEALEHDRELMEKIRQKLERKSWWEKLIGK